MLVQSRESEKKEKYKEVVKKKLVPLCQLYLSCQLLFVNPFEDELGDGLVFMYSTFSMFLLKNLTFYVQWPDQSMMNFKLI